MTKAMSVKPTDTTDWFEELGKPPHYVLPNIKHCVPLSAREREAAILLSRGCEYAEAAARMGVANSTMRDHIKTIHKKWQIADRADLVKYSVALGLVDLPKAEKLGQLIEGYGNLTLDEKVTLYWTSKGLSCKEIGREMQVDSENIVSDRRKSLYRVLGIREKYGVHKITKATLAYLALKMEADRLYQQKYEMHGQQPQPTTAQGGSAPVAQNATSEQPEQQGAPSNHITSIQHFPTAEIAPGTASFAKRLASSSHNRTAFR